MNEKDVIKPFNLPQLEKTPVQSSVESNLDLLQDIPLTVTVEIGRAKMLVKDVLRLTVGSVVELDKLAGEPVDILVNGKIIARGEVIAVNENYGIRITEIVK
ncbi:MAG: flagellar motor switch protein FliN [Candidatus Calescibacterium sp.]|nr:flagellar motor switch protein FliN [Candidatus Calescibacterium sp.]